MRHLLSFRYVDAIAKAGSIRKAAETLAITPSALNRRLLSLEEELGVEVFERLPGGVVLNVAGEILLEHIRNQISDMERVKSRIADLSGVRRGAVTIACTEEMIGPFLSDEVQRYRTQHPGVTFNIEQHIRGNAELALIDHSTDIALVFEATNSADLQVMHTSTLPVVVHMTEDHPLARKRILRLYECLEFPLLLPSASSGIRHLLEAAATRLGLKLTAAVQSNHQEFLWQQMRAEHCLSFRMPTNSPDEKNLQGVVASPLSTRDVPGGKLIAGQLRGRVLPVASARFMDQIISALAAKFE
ncbi:MAG: DNA-binding transcriptional LysR family regulator [Hyphomicrobiaceae bacterium]|jgi:DNA-binding transcriptional LysR family regulator